MNSTASRRVESTSWSDVHALILSIFSVGATLEAYIYSLSYVATTWVTVPRYLTALLASWPPLWLLVGGLVAGPVADAIGRKRAFYMTFAMYVVGSLMLIFSYSYPLMLTSIAVLLVAAGGEYHTILVSTHELFPRRHRAKALAIALDFTNVGGALITILALASLASVGLQRTVVGLSAIAVAVALFVLRLRLPESVMWLERTRGAGAAAEEAQRYFGAAGGKDADGSSSGDPPARLPRMWLRIAVGSILGWSYTAGFSLVALTIGPYYFPSLTDRIILVASAAAFMAGLSGLLFDRVSRRLVLVISLAGVLATTMAFIAMESAWLSNAALFWALLALVNAFVNVYFLAEDALKSEIWPVKVRGRYTALVRALSLGGSIPVIYLTASLPIYLYLWTGFLIFAAGLAAAVAWYIVGVETGMGTSVLIWDRDAGVSG